jgi:N-sulfoglucosamine sulfohydrolase
MNRPNILYLHSHDTGRYIQPYGHPVSTPALQLLAEQGVLFRQAFSAAPTCAPSRAAMLTGQCAHSAGMDGLTLSGFTIDYRRHLIHTLHAHGYTSALAGFQHVARSPENIGYQHRVTSRGVGAEQWAAEWLQRRGPKEGPFFLDVGFMETHRRDGDFWRDAQITVDPRYTMPPARFPDTPPTRLDWARYLASARTLDRKIESVLRALDASGHADNTIILYTTDHGLAFPDMKVNASDAGLEVGLILKVPALADRAGTVVDALVSQVDIFPTLCALIDVPPPQWLQGQSLLPLLCGDRDTLHDAVFGEVTYHGLYDPQRTIRTQRWRMIECFGQWERPLAVVAGHTDAGPTRDLFLASGWCDRSRDAIQLYDVLLDPQQQQNVAARPENQSIVRQLRERLHAWMERTGDPLLSGPIPLPEPGGFGIGPEGSPIALPPAGRRVGV